MPCRFIVAIRVTERAQELPEVEGHGHRRIEIPAANSSYICETKRPGERLCNPSRYSGRKKEEIADSGHQHARAQEVHIVHSGTTTEMDPKSDKKTACSEFRRRKTRQPQAHQEQKVDLRAASFMKEDSAEQVRFVPSTALATMTRRRVPNASHSQT